MAMFVIDDYRCVTSENCVMAKFAFWGSRENQLGSGYPSGCPGPLLCYNDGWGMRATHPSPPLSWDQSTNLPASNRALKALQRMLTTLNGRGVRFGSPQPGFGHPQAGAFGLRPLYCPWPRYVDLPLARPSLCVPSELRVALGGETITTPGVAGP